MIVGGARFGARGAPFEPVWNRDLFTAVHARADIPVFAVGGIRTAAECHDDPRRRARPTWSASAARSTRSPTSRRVCSATTRRRAVCVNSNRCVPAQMLGMKGICYNPDVRKR